MKISPEASPSGWKAGFMPAEADEPVEALSVISNGF